MTRAEPVAAPRPTSELRFVVVGAYHVDCLISTPRLPDWGDDLRPESIRTIPGGKGLNQSVTLARAGAHVQAVGVLGVDPVGSSLHATLAAEGVDVTMITRHPTVPTPACLVFTAPDGRNAFVWRPPDEYAVTPEVIAHAEKAIRDADAVLLTFEAPEPISRVAEIARAAGTTVIVNPAPRPADRSQFDAVRWDLVDVLIPNEAEARALLPDDHPGRAGPAEKLAEAVGEALAVPLVCVTLAERGCAVYDGARTRAYPAHPTEVLDTTGASDVFTAIFSAHHVARADQAEAVHRAQAAAALTITRPGAYEALPTRADLA
ncbi:ribokinase [Frankia sp. CNm7]|uniref:Ribokinase n=1 Tax=Frankia nepalensis TaxID=1836974 RepID=A0A937RSV5_9ACTN|nr:PfkB family carbohydrate kinase [Frankia nepalensis]MBL7500176.1 ribokinase [Frankia nepalensis]MBL7512408.1 ribokinase [Frankia nepalensis]MBL7518532.1 ribokinase [Frankia nepalensis]MBL7632724.1 ribokinase [Frankia nepalensis]